jgi:hypothetical protein
MATRYFCSFFFNLAAFLNYCAPLRSVKRESTVRAARTFLVRNKVHGLFGNKIIFSECTCVSVREGECMCTYVLISGG